MANQGDVRKIDKYFPSQMPDRERKRVLKEENDRATWQGNAQKDYMDSRDAESAVTDAFISAYPKATAKQLRTNPMIVDAEANHMRAQDNMIGVHEENRLLKEGKKGYQYAKGGMVRGDGCARKGKTKGRHC